MLATFDNIIEGGIKNEQGVRCKQITRLDKAICVVSYHESESLTLSTFVVFRLDILDTHGSFKFWTDTVHQTLSSEDFMPSIIEFTFTFTQDDADWITFKNMRSCWELAAADIQVIGLRGHAVIGSRFYPCSLKVHINCFRLVDAKASFDGIVHEYGI